MMIKMRAHRQMVFSGLAALCLVLAFSARATNTPVFRQALELWPASDYEIVVFHKGEMDTAGQTLVDQLRIARGQVFANIEVKTVDVSDSMEPPMENLWSCQTNPVAPWVVVRAPDTSSDASPVWAGHLTESLVGSLLDSPARRKIAESLMRGATAVWILLESGETTRDEAAVDTLSAELKRLEKSLALPKAELGEPRLRSPLPLGVEFALVRVTRTDPAEEFLVTLLQHGKQLFSARPAAFAVYGRGRMLGALVGREIEGEAIEAACSSLVAACIHETKDQNPGRDLLLAANWNTIFDPGSALTRAATPLSSILKSTPAPAVTGNSAGTPFSRSKIFLVIAVLTIAAGVLVFARARHSRDRGTP
ncbi:MAG: hypothetical protein QOF48_347 [Verrucomicrobiota bacterium]